MLRSHALINVSTTLKSFTDNKHKRSKTVANYNALELI
jgi:hypothetical protein